MSAALERGSDTEAALPYADDLPPDGPQEGLTLIWASPGAELIALAAVVEYDASPTGTHEEKMANLNLYVEARRLFAEGTGLEVWVDGNINRKADLGFLAFLEDFRSRDFQKVQQRIAVLRVEAARRKRAGTQALQATLLSE